LQEFVARIAVGGWDLVPLAGGTMEPCGDRPGAWRGVITVSGDVARAMTTPADSPLRLHTDSGLHLKIAVTRWSPVGSNAQVEFIGDEWVPAQSPARGGAA
jgi:hypothetical protein